jgi:hypothetical protein
MYGLGRSALRECTALGRNAQTVNQTRRKVNFANNADWLNLDGLFAGTILYQIGAFLPVTEQSIVLCFVLKRPW